MVLSELKEVRVQLCSQPARLLPLLLLTDSCAICAPYRSHAAHSGRVAWMRTAASMKFESAPRRPPLSNPALSHPPLSRPAIEGFLTSYL